MAFGSGKKITVRLDDELVEGLQAFADQERVSVSQVLRHLVLRFLRPSPPGAPLVSQEQIQPMGEGRLSPEVSEERRCAAFIRTEGERDKFTREVLSLFDGFRSQGYDPLESTKRTNFALKERKHPWATYEVIADVIRKTGRFRRVRLKGG